MYRVYNMGEEYFVVLPDGRPTVWFGYGNYFPSWDELKTCKYDGYISYTVKDVKMRLEMYPDTVGVFNCESEKEIENYVSDLQLIGELLK